MTTDHTSASKTGPCATAPSDRGPVALLGLTQPRGELFTARLTLSIRGQFAERPNGIRRLAPNQPDPPFENNPGISGHRVNEKVLLDGPDAWSVTDGAQDRLLLGPGTNAARDCYGAVRNFHLDPIRFTLGAPLQGFLN